MSKSSNGPYSPLYFLAAVGAGGLVVTFFMYLMFWVPHPSQPVPVFEDIWRAFSHGSFALQGAIVVALIGIAVFGALHFHLLFWNLSQMNAFRSSKAFEQLNVSNGQTQQLAMPLALAMSVNVAFIIGLVFVPNLWSFVEYLFPLALAVFAVIGLYALKLIGQFLVRVFGKGGFNHEANNSFAQLLPAFALSMVSVGLAAPAALSNNPTIVGISLILATFFVIAAIIFAAVAIVLGMHAMLKSGVAAEATPTLMVVVPILTVLGIALLRMNHGLHVHFDLHTEKAATFMMLAQFLAVQIIFAALGLLVLKRQNYAQNFLAKGSKLSAGSYALICPGVALSVMLHFFVNKGLVATGLIAKFGAAYWAFTTPALLLQLAMILMVFSLNTRHFGKATANMAEAPAE